MTKIIAENILQLIIVFPIILLTLKNRKSETLEILMAFIIFFLINQISLVLPMVYPELRISNWNSNWNWVGKIYAIIGAIAFLLVYRKFPLKDYFLTFKQESKFLKKGILIITSLLIIKTVLMFFAPTKMLNWETLFFQFSMPGINEEIAYRGIMLGLLAKILKSKNLILNTPVWITGILSSGKTAFYPRGKGLGYPLVSGKLSSGKWHIILWERKLIPSGKSTRGN